MRNYETVALDEIKKQIARPLPINMDDRFDDYFDPWEPFQFALFGSYSSEFDDVAILVLSNIRDGKWGGSHGEGVSHEMFREILCKADLCDYGSSPRGCFATEEFEAVLPPELVDKWVAYRALWDA